MQSFLNDQKVKDKYLARVLAHKEAAIKEMIRCHREGTDLSAAWSAASAAWSAAYEKFADKLLELLGKVK